MKYDYDRDGCYEDEYGSRVMVSEDDGITLIKAVCPPPSVPYVWPEGVTEIADFVFRDHFLTWASYDAPFSIPDTVIKIGAEAFRGWQSFNQPFSIPSSVKEIGERAFDGWRSFDQPNSARAISTWDWLRIGEWVFAGCWCGKVCQLRERLDNGASNSSRERAYAQIIKGLPDSYPIVSCNRAVH